MDFDRYQGRSIDDNDNKSSTYDYNSDFGDMDLNTWSICGDGTKFDDNLGQCIVSPLESFSIMNNEVVGYSKDFSQFSGPESING